MNDSKDSDTRQFNQQVAAVFAHIEESFDAAGLDVETVGDGILEVEFDDGSKIIINRHGVAQEIWVAARSGGFHFRRNESGCDWVDTRSAEPLYSTLSRLVSEQSGRAFQVS